MADLPQQRVTAARPFLHTGVDYAGPIWLRTAPGAEAFLATFRRFISRRGLCSDVYSDCGTNFQGADNELRRLFEAQAASFRVLQAELTKLRVQWHFNPPASPHFGGLWEAAVKSTKHHLRRVLGESKLTYEEMATFLSQVEAWLNSRPLSALSDDPQDLAALTPGHFLIGSAINALPEPTLLELKPSRLSRWQLLVQMRDQFWQRWVREYLHGLLTRPKWKQPDDSHQIGSLCLITTENTSPCRWPLARIDAVHPGADDEIRVCTLKTATTTLVRPIHKLVLLPVNCSPL
ncbi:uncharacterized protein LOC143363234 [Halictus rubicundus]|uniref:uncharacterized protein LOC143363234 n=1 Tax=Halictus rubicundus TaxID=77578 RepID=UPI0040355288